MDFVVENWPALLALGVGGWLGYELFLGDGGWFARFVGTLWGLGIWVVIGAAIVSTIRRWRRQVGSDRAHAEACEQRRQQYENDLINWTRTRPLTLLQQADDPQAALRRYVKPDGSLYLGVSPAAQAFVMAPRDYSVLLTAPSRWGKTNLFVIPAAAMHQGALVVVSTKPDVYDPTWRTRAQLGMVWSFDPTASTAPHGSIQARYSPLLACPNWDSSIRTAKAMVGATPLGGEGKGSGGNEYWLGAAKMLLAPMLFAAALHPDCDMLDVVQWINDGDLVTPGEILQEVANTARHPHRRGATLAGRQLVRFSKLSNDPRHFNGIVGTAQEVLSVYNSESVIDTVIKPNFDVERFVRSTDTVYITASSSDQEAVAPLIAAFLEHVQTAVYRYNRESSFMSCGRPSLLMLLDEAANVAPVKALPRYVSEGGSQGLQVVVCLQSLAQAEIPWPVQGKSLIEYFGAILATGGITNETTLRALSVLTGDEYRQYVSRSYSWSASTSESQSSNEGWSGGYFFGQTSYSIGEGTTTTYSTSDGHTITEQKQRRMTEADIASLQPGQGFLYSVGKWRIIDLVGTNHWAWRRLLEKAVEPPPAEVAPPLPHPHAHRSTLRLLSRQDDAD